MALTPEQKSEVDRLVNQKIAEFKAEQETRNVALKVLKSSGKVLSGTEEQLLTLLEKEGVLIQENGQFLANSKDKYGYPIKEEISKVLPSLLKGNYSHFSTDDAGINQQTPLGTQSEPSGLTTQALYKMAQEGDSRLDTVFEQARQLYS